MYIVFSTELCLVNLCVFILHMKCTLLHLPVAYSSLSWIPTKILHCYYRQSIEDKLLVERCLLSCLVPINLGDDERMERLVRVYAALEDEHATK